MYVLRTFSDARYDEKTPSNPTSDPRARRWEARPRSG